MATQVLRSFAVNLELFDAWKKVRKQKILSYLSHRKQDHHFHKADVENDELMSSVPFLMHILCLSERMSFEWASSFHRVLFPQESPESLQTNLFCTFERLFSSETF